MQDPLEEYVVNLLKSKGEPDTPESRAALLEKANEAINKALVEALPLEQLAKLEDATKENQVDDSTVEKLLTEVGADPSKIISDAMNAFKNEYMKGTK